MASTGREAGHALDRKVPLAHLPTPLEAADRLAEALGKPPRTLWIKRDDLTGLAGGGNKARKLEYLCADALDRGCDVLVTGGGLQSNHVRMTAAAANYLGLGCTLVLGGPRPRVPTGNLVVDELLGPEIIWAGTPGTELDYYGVEAAIEAACGRLTEAGHRPYLMPIGGASAMGALGYVWAALELQQQWSALEGMDGSPDLVVVADGSGGTHAGLAAGLADHRLVFGIDVGARPDLDVQVPAKAAEAAALAGLEEPAWPEVFKSEGVAIDHRHFGDAYGAATDECREAVRLAARTEGIVLDPVYTGKAMAGLVAACRSGRIAPNDQVVFVHTGGFPALFAAAYAGWVRGD